ncbi:hypothetical protein [Streptomyces xanthochromogenes]
MPISAAETVKCQDGDEHWHGATGTTLTAHIALVVSGGKPATWLEPVADEQYDSVLPHS